MTFYFRTTDQRVIDIDPVEVAKLAPAKQQVLLVWVPTNPPVVAGKAAEPAPPALTATQATQAWALRDKTADELAAEAQSTEMTALKAMLVSLATDIQAGVTAAPTSAAQAFVDIQEIKRQVLRLNRSVRWMLKQQA